MKYEELRIYSDEEIKERMQSATDEELCILALSVGEYNEDFSFAQDICFRLLSSENEDVCANAVFGLSYLARRFKKLNIEKTRELVKRITFTSKINIGKVEDEIEDISMFAGEEIII